MVSKRSSSDGGAEALLRTWPQVFFFYFVGLSLFFIVAFVIVTLRISHKGEVSVPSLVGKTYLEVHNGLQESGFEIKLKNTYSTNYPYGYIVSQSLSPGKIVKIGQKVTLLVNQSKNIIKTPTLVGTLESIAPKILGNVHSGERRFKLISGVVTHVSSDRPKGLILAQYPLPKTPVPPEYPVSYLVSLGNHTESSARDSKKAPNNEVNGAKSLNRQQKKKDRLEIKRMMNELDLHKKVLNIEIVKAMSYHMKIPLEIDKTSVERPEQDGLVLEYSLLGDRRNGQQIIWKVNVGYYDKKNSKEEKDYPFQFIWVSPQELGINQGVYTVAQRIGAQSDRVAEEGQQLLSGLSYVSLSKNQLLPLFKTFSDEFLIWNGYHAMPESVTYSDQESKLPDETYSPEDILP